MAGNKDQYALFYSAKQATIAGKNTVTTPGGESYTYTEMTTVKDGEVKKPTSNFDDFNQVAVIDRDVRNKYTTRKKPRQSSLMGMRLGG